MRFLQIHTFYPEYLDSLYSRFKHLGKANYKDQIDILITDAFSAVHMIAPYMSQVGYKSRLIIANCLQAQFQWLKENSNTNLKTEKWTEEIVRKQIDEFEPDILYLSDPINYNGSFIRTLNHKPKLIIGWRAATFPYNIDWTGFDIMLSSLRPLLDHAIQRGAKHGELFLPGFPTKISEKIRTISASKDIVFAGQYTTHQHGKRGYFLKEIARAATIKGFECIFHLSGQKSQIPNQLHPFLAPPAYGLSMHKALRQGRIAFDSRADHFVDDPIKKTRTNIGGDDTANMRIFEATGSGVFLLTEHFSNISHYFDIGKEVETFTDRKNLIEKIDYYLAHPDQREEIANKGQARCLNHHSMGHRVQELDRIIRKYLSSEKHNAENGITLSTNPNIHNNIQHSTMMKNILLLITEKKFEDAMKLLSNVKATNHNLKNVDYYRALTFAGMNDTSSAEEALKEELRHHPDNTDAKLFFETILSNRLNKFKKQEHIDEFEKIFLQISAHTMLGKERLISLYTHAKKICIQDFPGHFVECGVAAGGSSALLAWIIKKYSKRPRLLFCFDTFEGMPDPTLDDVHANIPANDTGWGAGTCSAPMRSLVELCEKLDVSNIIFPVKGLFKNTLPNTSENIGDIALLHMDGDWYESTCDILNNLYQKVIPQGFIHVDDYGYWDGCKKALHEHESKLDVKFELHHIDDTGVWFIKPHISKNLANSKLLNLGCGQRYHSSWVNIDFKSDSTEVIAHDLGKGLPFEPNSFDVIYHSHLLEHFSKEYARLFMKDCYRILRPGGIIRVVVPDLETIARLYVLLLEKSLKGDEEAQNRYEWIMLELFDQMVRNLSGGSMLDYWHQNPIPAEDFVVERLGSEVKEAIARIRVNPDISQQLESRLNGKTIDPLKIGQFRLSGEIHQWMYDRYSLVKLLQNSGFVDTKVCRADESRIPDFNSYLLDIETDGSVRKPDSLFIEARKPDKESIETDDTKDISQLPIVIAQFCMQDFGGAGTAALRLHDGLISSGMKSSFYVHNIQRWKPGTVPLSSKTKPKPGSNNKIISSDWITFHEHNQRVISRYPQRPHGLELFTDTWATSRLSELPEIAKADIIHLHWIAGTLDISKEVELLKSKKIVWTLHDMNAFTGGCHYAAGCKKYEQQCGSCPQLGSNQANDLSRQIWARKYEAFRQLDITIVTPSLWLANCVKRSTLLSSFPVHVIPYGLPTDIYRPYSQSQIRHSLQIPKDVFVILFGAESVANARKGFVHLLKALEHLKTQHSRDQIALATFGSHAQATIQHLHLPTFIFDYMDKESELAMVYSMADVTVIPSLEDNLPNVVLESLACGTPVVGFDVGGIPDMVEHQINGYIATVGDNKKLADGMRWVMEQKKTGSKIRLKCRETVLSQYTLPLQAQRYRMLYEKILGE